MMANNGDECEAPRRKRIGWNYQSLNFSEPKTNSLPRKVIDDDIEIVDIDDEETNSVSFSVSKQPVVPQSSTRKEIKDHLRNVKQSKIQNYFKKGDHERETPTKNKVSFNLNTQELKNGQSESNKISVESNTSSKNSNNHSEDESLGATNESNSSSEPKPCAETIDSTEPELETGKNQMEKFIDKWKSIKTFTSEDRRICDKLWKAFHSSHTTYTHSRNFSTGIQRAIETIDNDNVYVILKKIMHRLKDHKDVPYVEKVKKPKTTEDDNKEEGEVKELTDAEKKKQRRLARIEKEMMKLSKKIKALEEAEVDWDDEDNGSYVMQERLQRQFMRLDEYYCKQAECSMSTGRPIEKKFTYSGSRYSEINKRISAWVNKHRDFPDYSDILDLVRKETANSLLPMRPETVRVQAQEIFRDVGRLLKIRREKDDFFSIYAYAGENDEAPDPADQNDELYNCLRKNEKGHKERLDKVFQHFVDCQIEVDEKEREELRKKKEESSKAKSDNVEKERGTSVEKQIDTDGLVPDKSSLSSCDNGKVSSQVVNQDDTSNDALVTEESNDTTSNAAQSLNEEEEKLDSVDDGGKEDDDAKEDEDDGFNTDIELSSDSDIDIKTSAEAETVDETAEEDLDQEEDGEEEDVEEEEVDEDDLPSLEDKISAIENIISDDEEFDDEVKDILNCHEEKTGEQAGEDYECGDEDDYLTEEDVDIYDSDSSPVLENEDKPAVATTSSHSTTFSKRKLDLKDSSSKKMRCQSSSPEIVELD